MSENIKKTIEVGEYTVVIEYDNDGGIDVEVFDLLGGVIEGLYISDSVDNGNVDPKKLN